MVNTNVGVYMDNKEKELEQLVEKVKNESDLRFPPIFEMYATLFSLSVSILMFIFPNMLQPDTNLYTWMLKIMPQFMWAFSRSEEHTSELQSRFDLVCRLLLEKK